MRSDYEISFPGYTITEMVGETSHSSAYRACRDTDQGTVIIKTLRVQEVSPSEKARFKHEYEIIRGIENDGIIKSLDLIDHEGTLALVLEDFGGIPLKEFLKQGFTLERFLELAIRLSEILGVLHRNGISHRDIKPLNILLNPETDQLKITDFGINAEITQLNDAISNPAVIEDTLAYISPEQTGRMNCAVDYRTDLYSLGIVFYEMLTHEVPFQSRDAMEIIHSHLAKVPVPPVRLNPDLPEVVSAMVMKLLSKAVTERYQNGFGLASDLRECLYQWRQSGRIEPFTLGSQDIALRFLIPQSLVGRDAEAGVLQTTFDRVGLGAVEVVLVTGEPGIGKSALVNEIRKPLAGKRGYFISGKYDQFYRVVPYSAIIQAFQALVQQLLAESDEGLSEWRERLLAALGTNAKIITDAIPAIELIVGRPPAVPELGPEENQNRFNLCFKNFVRVFAARSHPLVLFLDDLQWADSASLNLIRTITTDRDLSNFLLIGAYRDTEVAANHPFILMRDAIQATGVPINTIHLAALNPQDINQLVSTFLRCEAQVSQPLAQAIHAKTKGSPFFVNQFLKTLYDQHYLILDENTGWIWDLEKIRELQVTENVVEFMADRLGDLPASRLEILQVCACIGNRFDLETLSLVTDRSIEEILEIIDDLMQDGLINHMGNLYRFHHDRIQEAAYSLLPEGQREKIHYKIGLLDLERTPPEQRFNRIFYICDQLNQAHRLVSNRAERRSLAALNLKAGIKAKESTAYAAAVSYLTMGHKLLAMDVWETDYELAYALYSELMECQYLNWDHDEAQRLFEIIIAKAATKIDKAKAYNTMIILYTNTRTPREATKLGLKALLIFGINLKIDMGVGLVINELIKAKRSLKKVGLENITNLPLMQDEEAKAIGELMFNLGTSAYYVNENLFAYMCLKGANDCLKHGLASHAGGAFATMATIVQSALGDYALGYRLGEMALKVNEKMGNRKVDALVRHAVAFFILHWKKHIKNELEIYAKVYELSINAGDFIYAGMSVTATADCRMQLNHRLDDVLDDLRKHDEFIALSKDSIISKEYQQYVQWIMAMQGLTPVYQGLGSGAELAQDVEQYKQEGNVFGLCIALYYKMTLFAWLRRYDEAYQMAAELDNYIKVPMGAMLVANHHFHYSLILIALLQQGAPTRQRAYRTIIRRNQRKLKKWAKNCPENFKHMHDLVAAELAGLNGRFLEAVRLYHAAVNGAHDNGFLPAEALACELLADFYLAWDHYDEASIYIKRAHRCHTDWGATAKVFDLQERYPNLLLVEDIPGAADAVGQTIQAETASRTLDLETVMHVSQVISGEIKLDRLLQQTMHMSVANAGAQRGYLIFESDGCLRVQASEDVDTGVSQVLQAVPLDDCAGLSPAIVHYVHHSGENLILGNAIQEGSFRNDPHVHKDRCKSILCLPIMNKGVVMAILYMENNLTADAFTPDRLEILQTISAQAAISLQNAQLYENITKEIHVRQQAEHALHESYKTVQTARMATILGLAKLAEYRDEATGAHLERIREYARILAQELSVQPEYQGYITQEYIEDIYNSAILHDIGKVGVPDAILLKPGKLTPDEFEVIKTHTTLGGDALKSVEEKIEGKSFLTLGKEIAYYHHEKWDGSGYPAGLKGEDIPLSARIVALADVYDALTSKRTYKDAFTHRQAMEIIVNDRGTHFAPYVVDAFMTHREDFRRIREDLLGE